ncbi:DUF3536 domain-containing protein [Desulfovibrio ferrophilus]|uniref:Alpha-amylase/alpha-mannosidase n=1 Tax=Desulfovibrio ferrophilus TaxID=241368 RepID=A0A2Z6B0G6_9BACT|nr:DUF3536 domain-containing protein [Desulfovibrio ferrophilus]BBD08963.1 alpha-amylase/alpha-mannosidase [Desulfovibrio ferrophilus]
MSDQQLCIHGHFYQPPREDPWLGEVLPEGSAAPELNWNERICRESYAPLAFARILNDAGQIQDIINAYEWISFNFGPTLLSWMHRHAPETYARILEGDRLSRSRLGFGNAMAQVRHHVIMPLATEREKRVEVAWAVHDFQARYKRLPDGMWLAETAVDTATLEVLAEAGIAYTILAPRQAQAVTELGSELWQDVHEGTLDITAPYRMDLPSGRSISIFFYHGGLSQAVAFERLLENGEAFWTRVRKALTPGLLSLATDGETYGHHFTFGEMGLAYLLKQADRDPDVVLTNYAAYLAATPPTHKVRLHQESSWSCAHGVERWRGDCGCSTEGRPGWNQQWRLPLRRALRLVKDTLDTHFDQQGASLFRNQNDALEAYGQVLAGGARSVFETTQFNTALSGKDKEKAWTLLDMQRYAQASFASCAWFFDDLDRIEPLNAMANALRAMELAGDSGIPIGCAELERQFSKALQDARSNPTRRNPGGLRGDELFLSEVLTRRETPVSLMAQALLMAWGDSLGDFNQKNIQIHWPEITVSLTFKEQGEAHTASGTASFEFAGGEISRESIWYWKPASGTKVLQGRFRIEEEKDWFPADALPWGKRQALVLAWAKAAEENGWERDLLLMQTGRDLFLPLAESQNNQNQARSWGRFRPALAWSWITSPGDDDDLLEAFLKATEMDSDGREALQRRLQNHLLSLLELDTPDLNTAEQVLRRSQDICPGLDFWPVQNRIWLLLSDTPEAKPLAQLLGIAV